MGHECQKPSYENNIEDMEARPSLDAILQVWKVIDAQLADLSKRLPSIDADDELATENGYLDTQSRLLNMASEIPARSLSEVHSKMALWKIEATGALQSEPPCRADGLLRSVERDLMDLCALADNSG